MKKQIVLLLLFVPMASAHAGLQISVNGIPEPPDSEIVLSPSETATLAIWTDADIPSNLFIYWALVANVEEASISGGIAVPPFDDYRYYSCVINDDATGELKYPAPNGTNGVAGAIAIYGPTSFEAGTTIFDEINLHAERLGDTLLYLVTTPDFVNYEIEDTVIVHVPEPITAALLALGGLGLLRRRRHF